MAITVSHKHTKKHVPRLMAIFCSVEPTEKSIAVGASKSVISEPLELLTTTHETPQKPNRKPRRSKVLQKNNHCYQPGGRVTSIQTPAGREEDYNPRFLAFSHKKFTGSEPEPLLLQQAAASSLVSAKKTTRKKILIRTTSTDARKKLLTQSYGASAAEKEQNRKSS